MSRAYEIGVNAMADETPQEILSKYQSLAEEHSNLKNDYLSERDIRRNYQRTVEEKQSVVGDYERQLVGCQTQPFPVSA
jgi:hypothetical protein